MLESPLHRDHIELLADGLQPADETDTILLADLGLDGGGCGKEPRAHLTEGLEEGAVIEAPHHPWAHALLVEPVLHGSAER